MKIKLGKGKINIERLSLWCGGELFGNGVDIEYVCTDSREVDGSTLFVVSVGERVDGHNYMLSAAKNGCRAFLCQRIPDELKNSELSYTAIVVENSIDALAKISEEYIRELSIKTVAVTGSVGKTTTKEFIYAVLSSTASVHKTKANHNSTVGMPMSMLEADERYDLSVVEMGMSGFGEIELMSRVARPSVACITNIGSSHLELLLTRENICRAKLEIISGMDDGGTVIINGDEPLLTSADLGNKRRVLVGIGNKACDIKATNMRYGDDGSVFDVEAYGKTYENVEISVIGKQFVYASLFAIAVGLEMGIPEGNIIKGLKNFKNADMRQNIYEVAGITIIEDCYNASPESMRAAIEVLRTLSVSKKNARMTALLGDMRELGENSKALHKEIGQYFADRGGSLLMAIGELGGDIALGALEGGMNENMIYMTADYQNCEMIGNTLYDLLCEGDILLVKASRAIGAEKIVEYLKSKLIKK